MAKKNFVAYGDAETLMTEVQDHLSLRPKTWKGTQAEWDALTLAEKKSYDRADITDDSESGDVDTIPTENSPNLITSGGVYSANQNIYEVMGKNGAKNLLPNIGASNTINGITYTVNEDGSVTADGTATSNSEFILIQHNSDIATEFKQNIIGKTLILSGCPDGGGSSKYHVRKWGQGSSGTYYDQGKGVTLTPTLEEYDSYTWNFQIRIMSGTTVSNLLFKPMLRLASDADNTYQPYAKTNRQLTEDCVDWDNFSKLGAVNYSPNNFTDKTNRGITFDVADDGTITVNTESGGATANENVNISFTLKKGTYKLTGCPSGGSNTTYRLYVAAGSNYFDYGDGVIFTLASDTTVTLYCSVLSGAVITTPITFKPMITVPSYNGDYVPYAKSNRELTEDVAEMARGGAYVYPLPSYFYHIAITATKGSGQFIKLITNHGEVKITTSSNGISANSLARQKVLINDNTNQFDWTYSVSGMTANINSTGHCCGWLVSNYPLTFTIVDTSTPEANTLETLNLALLSNS